MSTHTTGTNHRKYEPDLGAFDNYRTQFRQYLLERNYAESTIGSYLRCIGGLVELMKVEGITFGELDETQAVGLVAKTGWTQRRKIYATFIMSRFVRFLADRGVGKPALPPTAKEIARTELRRDYSNYLRRQRG
jgi:integrase/recombinase XerD